MIKKDGALHFSPSRVQGVANTALPPHVVLRLVQIVFGELLGRILIGKDTRKPNYCIEASIMAGVTSVGAFAQPVGPIPAPAIAELVRSMRCAGGVMISGNGESAETSGITFFDEGGEPLPQERWEHIVARFNDPTYEPCLAQPREIGRAKRIEDVQARYVELTKRLFPTLTLDGMRIVVDCAHGAAYQVAPQALFELGGEVIKIGCDPDGNNINCDVGPLHPHAAMNEVRRLRADVGIILSSDGSACTMLDERGHEVPREMITAALPRHDTSEIEQSIRAKINRDGLVYALFALAQMRLKSERASAAFSTALSTAC